MLIKKRDGVVYYGMCVTERARKERALPSWNTAATRRMIRIANAVQCNKVRCYIVSPGIVPRIKGRWGFRRPIVERRGHVVVITAGQIFIPYVGYLVSFIKSIMLISCISHRRNLKAVIQYCYYPDTILTGIWCRLVYGCRVVLDCEDISKPKFSDWRLKSETRPLQQIWGWFLMKVAIRVAHIVIVLSRKFYDEVPKRKAIIVSGCQDVSGKHCDRSADKPVVTLLSGGISRENGMDLYIDALHRLDNMKCAASLRFVVCGSGKMEMLKDSIRNLKNLDVQVLGRLSDDDFNAMYREVDICFALQDPDGRHGRYKVPSKGYEAICSGKVLIAGDIGDIEDIPDAACYHLRPYTSVKLAELLSRITSEEICSKMSASLEYARKHYDLPVVSNVLRRACNL